jgi:hypothetical protein
VQGGSKGEIYKSVDAMGRIMVRQNQRVIDFSPRENSFGKNPCNLDIIPFPDPHTTPDTLANIIITIKRRINELSVEQKAAQDELGEWVEALADFKTPEDFNQAMADLKAAPRSVKELAANKAKALGFVFNKQAGIYEDNRVSA